MGIKKKKKIKEILITIIIRHLPESKVHISAFIVDIVHNCVLTIIIIVIIRG